jgi:hypothetical protein
MVFDRCRIDPLAAFVNRKAVFPIHRSVRFVLFTATRGEPTQRVKCRFGLTDADWLDALPNHPRDDPPDAFPVDVSRQLLERIGGADLAVPELQTRHDVSIVERLVTSFPPLGALEGWGASFGRELNATDDRGVLIERATVAERPATTDPSERLPVVEGKRIHPFAVDVQSARYDVLTSDAARLLRSRPFDRPRLAYRDVASPTNRLTLIAAIVPARTVSTHTVFCLRGRWNDLDQAFLCGVLNSYVANYLVRLRVGTHVTVGIVAALPVPRPGYASPAYRAIADLAATLIAARGEAGDARMALQAEVARLYALTVEEYAHVLGTFPLVPSEERDGALDAFRRLDALDAERSL